MNPSGDLTPAGPARQQRGIQLPQLLLSLLVVGVFALLAVWWQASSTSRSPVLALASDVRVGDPITAADLTEIYISTDVPPRVEQAEFASSFVGTLPVADFDAGTFVTSDMFRRGTELAPGQAFVGLVLDPTRAPFSLSVGDRVQVLDRSAVPGDGDGVEILSFDAAVDSARYDGDQLVVRLQLPELQAQRVQLNAGSVVLIEVDNSGPSSWELDGDGTTEEGGDS